VDFCRAQTRRVSRVTLDATFYFYLTSNKTARHCVRGFAARKRVAKVLKKQRKNREKKQIRQQNKKKKGKKNTDSKNNVSSNVRIDGFENTDANL
jgi:hypothetical protein